jgi:hypothetical protein
MADRPLPPDLRQKWGHLRWLKYKGNGEWSAECPICHDDGHDDSKGKPDRFMIFDHLTGTSKKSRGKCRRCGHLEWLDDDPAKPITPKQRRTDEKERRELAQLQEQKYIDRKKWLREQSFWRDFHHQMTKFQRDIWHKTGVGDWAIDLHRLGYSERDDGALSIPYLEGSDINTLQFRLMKPPSPGDKYRFLSGTRAELFRVWPDEPLSGVILITEGAKKGIITFQGGPYTYQGESVTVISVPMKNVPERLIKQLVDADLLIWLLDPDAYEVPKTKGKAQEPAIARNIKLSGNGRCLMVKAPEKIDDMFALGLSPKSFQNMLNQAQPYIPKENKHGRQSKTYRGAS